MQVKIPPSLEVAEPGDALLLSAFCLCVPDAAVCWPWPVGSSPNFVGSPFEEFTFSLLPPFVVPGKK